MQRDDSDDDLSVLSDEIFAGRAGDVSDTHVGTLAGNSILAASDRPSENGARNNAAPFQCEDENRVDGSNAMLIASPHPQATPERAFSCSKRTTVNF
jgi:hypothetical protein